MPAPPPFATGAPAALPPGGARTSAGRGSPDGARRGRFEGWPSRLSTVLGAVAALVLAAVFSEGAAAQCTLPTPPSETPPDPVTGDVTVTPLVGGLAVSWNPVTGANRYVVQWRSGSEVYDPARGATVLRTSHVIGGLTPGIEHMVRVFAATRVNLGSPETPEWVTVCNSASSRPAAGNPLAPPAPPSPLDRVTGVGVEPGVESLRVSWRAVDEAGGYRVQWRSGSEDYGPASREAAASGTSYTIPGLTPGVLYTLRVIATRAGRPDGPPSGEATGTPLPAPLGRVTGVRVEPGVESLRVSWRAVDEAGGYRVQWRSGNEDYGPAGREAATTVTTGDLGTSYTITGLAPGTSYTLRVIATRAGRADGPPSDEATGTTLRRIFVSIAGGTSVAEGAAATLSVRLSESFPLTVTVTWTTVDGTAKAGADYRAETAGRLTFPPGDRTGTLRVRTLEDPRTEPAETFRVRLTEAANAALAAGADSATVTITDDDAEAGRGLALGKVLAAAGRWIAADAVDAVGERFAAPAAGAPASAAAAPRTAAGDGSGISRDGRGEGGGRRSAEELLARSWFDLPLGKPASGRPAAGDAAGAGDAPARWRLWARGTAGGFGGRPEDGFRLDGEWAGGYLGLDHRLAGGALAGVAIAHGRGGVDYAIDSVTAGEVDLELTSVLPYAHFRPPIELT